MSKTNTQRLARRLQKLTNKSYMTCLAHANAFMVADHPPSWKMSDDEVLAATSLQRPA